jgi:D-alanyl-D-alanine carboxypeptidase (penicillin-binding protein 5/6)
MRRIPGNVFSAVFLVLAALSPADPLVPAGGAPPHIRSRAAVLMDAATETVLYSFNPGLSVPPASLTKLMTIHLVLEAIKDGRASGSEIIIPPPESWALSQPFRSSLMFLDRDQRVSLDDILLGLAVSSGNDAAAAAALRFAPSLDGFALLMNAEAERLGLASTRFVEPSGFSSANRTTAMDFARFCSMYTALHPQALFRLHSAREFSYPKNINAVSGRARTIVQFNHNPLIGVGGVDGLKTGYIPEAGYNIALTALRNETRLVAVLLGAPGETERAVDGKVLLDWGFRSFKTLWAETGTLPRARIWKGKDSFAGVAAAGRFGRWPGKIPLTVSEYRGGGLNWTVELQDELIAPLPAGSAAGTLILTDYGGVLCRVPLVLENAARKGGFWRGLGDGAALFLYRLKKRLRAGKPVQSRNRTG